MMPLRASKNKVHLQTKVLKKLTQFQLQKRIAQFQEPEPIDATQTVNKQLQSEEKVIQQADQVSTPEEIVSYHPLHLFILPQTNLVILMFYKY